MSFSQDELQSLIEKVEISQVKARRRTIIAVLVPTVAAILYLGFTVWLIYIKQHELNKIEGDLKNRKYELSQVEQELSQKEELLKKTEGNFKQQNEQIRQAQQKISQGNTVAAQEQIASINTSFEDNEVNGFRAILKGDLENARRLFEAAYNASPTYHNVDEIYHQVLTQGLVRAYSIGSPNEKQSIQLKIMQEIVAKYSWGIPEDLLSEMKSRLAS
ncbi:hypothetical protein C7B65_16315 [Phormidesmis priestleyi ULC007]|uniref:Uncharacterized protein n=1 Tax=Phormidesmis priestleyi ULC007 TaxID=1920490 RepID=A0A2T1DC82_9CYAN|nr:hypothetical protein [Phormidesmis priestleyi]PSB18085.1 hypothetical protein C7B65_16315 [Phormidesmis priestleyi ULC007]PZO49644.1 MAG: hypothetical protein DCF14_13915 [Phormidesmis priestleyi]